MDYLLANSPVVSGLIEISGTEPTLEDVLMPYCDRDRATFDRVVASIEVLRQLTDEKPVFSNILKDPPQYPYGSLNGQDLEELTKLIDYFDLSGPAVEKTREVIKHKYYYASYKTIKESSFELESLNNPHMWIYLEDLVGLRWVLRRNKVDYCELLGDLLEGDLSISQFKVMFDNCCESFDESTKCQITQILSEAGKDEFLRYALENGCTIHPDILKVRKSVKCFEVAVEYGAIISDEIKEKIFLSRSSIDRRIKEHPKLGPIVAIYPKRIPAMIAAKKDAQGFDAFREKWYTIKRELTALLGREPTHSEVGVEYNLRKDADLY